MRARSGSTPRSLISCSSKRRFKSDKLALVSNFTRTINLSCSSWLKNHLGLSNECDFIWKGQISTCEMIETLEGTKWNVFFFEIFLVTTITNYSSPFFSFIPVYYVEKIQNGQLIWKSQNGRIISFFDRTVRNCKKFYWNIVYLNEFILINRASIYRSKYYFMF